MNQIVKEIRRGRHVKNKLAEPIGETLKNFVQVLLETKPKATGFWYN